jgi:tetratricopeptide (TPR) repeat protein
MAQILVDHNRLDEAQQELNRALELAPAMAAARNTLGALRLKEGDVSGGEREIRSALQQKPDLRLAHFNLAVAAENRGDLASAVAEYLKEIELFPGSYMAHFNLGKTYERLGRRHEQMLAFKAAITANPDFAEGYLFLAKLFLDVGELAEARSMALTGLGLSPRSDVAPLGHFVLSDVFAREGRPSEAEREAAEGRRLVGKTSKE